MKVRFPNDSDFTEVSNFKFEDFKVGSIFDTEVFGWWGDTYVSIPRFDYDEAKMLSKIPQEQIDEIVDNLADSVNEHIIEGVMIEERKEAINKHFMKGLEESKHEDIRLMVEDYKTLVKQGKHSEEFLKGYLSSISDLSIIKKTL